MTVQAELKPTEIVTDPSRLAFASLFKPTPKHPTTPLELKYQATILLPPDTDLKPFAKCIEAASIEKWGKVIALEGKAMPLKKCDGKTTADGRAYSGFDAGWWNVKAMNKYAPEIVDQAKRPIIGVAANASPEDIEKAIHAADLRVYSGCWCRFFLRAFAWDNAAGKGVSFSLELVQLVKDDEKFAGRKTVDDVFTTIDTGADDVVAHDAPVGEADDVLGKLLG